ncbi:5'-nucleotidase C-terminal domain-containing protein [Bacteriovorax sp. Seq25_V]|uniref:5'-nucleotidase C-terminal domain-containing protein n=1 Tax=Bacteriovorax sp. Seq25_V TaxID=1201288 RepID=UPI00038A32D4|nr:5'-nucleotidase C-terminal domain-containing protein [Bacteriovorax sp. Seq25_V]EQC44234.1 endonuclease/exonuclease/phosphatase family protein [Bacteriovorax sp. Seq25_V]
MKYTISLLFISLFFTSCSDKGYRLQNDEVAITASASMMQSSKIGNLVTSAMKETNGLDMVLFPSELLPQDIFSLVYPGMTATEITEFVNEFSSGVKDQFRVGVMSGKDIKALIAARAKEKYYAAFQVAGIKYHIHYVGGMARFENFEGDEGVRLEDKRKYRIAVSEYFYFSGTTFPSYKYKNGMNRTLRETGETISVKESLTKYLRNVEFLPYLDEIRALVTTKIIGDVGFKTIPQIQGETHLSPYYGNKVKTTGIITAVAAADWFPGGTDLYIQTKTPDANPKTSEAVFVHLDSESLVLDIGDEIELSGVVYEDMTTSGLSLTSIKEVSSLKIISKDNLLPAPVKLGHGGLEIPSKHFSTFIGNLNDKKTLNLDDAIDFYESLEGMRINFNSPRVVGFRGGNEEFEELSAKGHLTLYVKVDGDQQLVNETPDGGVIVDEINDLHNPDILQIISSHLSTGIPIDYYYQVGQTIEGQIEGVLTYSKNLFGGGEFAVVIPQKQNTLTTLVSTEAPRTQMVPLEKRPIAPFDNEDDALTVATYNVENLAGNQQRRIDEIGKSIRVNLKCPDIVNLVEIQDFNGIDFKGGASAVKTLQKLIAATGCSGVDYGYINIDPIENGEGGQPGGNIRVAMIYNKKKLGFSERKMPTSISDTYVLENGSINYNPGRVYANDDAFEHTRRSIVAEFSYKGKRLYVVGNHFNSKLGDSDRMGAVQPFVSGSETKRVKLAKMINNFVQRIQHYDSEAIVFVMGDFNANLNENSMKVLAGDHMTNLVGVDALVDFNDRYTTNHNGTSQPLDYIFATNNVFKYELQVAPLHINSDYMGRLSDHDPVVAKIKVKLDQ